MDTVLSFLHSIWTAFNSLPPEVLTQIGQVLITIVIGSPVFLAIKKIIVKDREKIMTIVVFFGTIIAGASVYLSTMPHTGIWVQYTTLIAMTQGLVTYAAITPFYLLIIKPLYKAIRAKIVASLADAAAHMASDNELKTAVVPADGLVTDQK